MLETYQTNQWGAIHSAETQYSSIQKLEQGNILYFPKLNFALSAEEQQFLTPEIADPKSKNIGYDERTQKLWGMQNLDANQQNKLKNMLARYFQHAHTLIQHLFPNYTSHLILGRTSFRPQQIIGRQSSYRKDDKRLHVDAFPSSPNQGKRILRVFCNINPHNQDRVWRIGEPFEQVAEQFLPRIRAPFPGTGRALKLLKITKSLRTAYDHYMLHLHDNMKFDLNYQKNATQETVGLPANSAWIVQTDHVSHAAMSGQYLLEQTFYLPVHAMQDEMQSPLRILEKLLKRSLV